MTFLCFIIFALGFFQLEAKIRPLSHQEVIDFRTSKATEIQTEKATIKTAYDAVAILSLANRRSIENKQYFSRLIQAVSLGYGLKKWCAKKLGAKSN